MADPEIAARSRLSALCALLLLLPVPSLAILVNMYWYPNTDFGRTFFTASKLWILLLPLAWTWMIDGSPLRWARPSWTGVGAALASGIAIAGLIVLVYVGIGRQQIDPVALREVADQVGLSSPGIFLALALYWILINSLLEEYVWRWFVVKQGRKLLGPVMAIVLSAAGFSAHHLVVMQIYVPFWLAAVAAFGVFCGGVIWSWMYLRFGNIWPGYLSHAIVDVAIFAIAYTILFP